MLAPLSCLLERRYSRAMADVFVAIDENITATQRIHARCYSILQAFATTSGVHYIRKDTDPISQQILDTRFRSALARLA